MWFALIVNNIINVKPGINIFIQTDILLLFSYTHAQKYNNNYRELNIFIFILYIYYVQKARQNFEYLKQLIFYLLKCNKFNDFWTMFFRMYISDISIYNHKKFAIIFE